MFKNRYVYLEHSNGFKLFDLLKEEEATDYLFQNREVVERVARVLNRRENEEKKGFISLSIRVDQDNT